MLCAAISAKCPLLLQTGFAVEPLRWCAHLDDITKLSGELDTSEPCGDCGHVGENWVCLTCYKVGQAYN